MSQFQQDRHFPDTVSLLSSAHSWLRLLPPHPSFPKPARPLLLFYLGMEQWHPTSSVGYLTKEVIRETSLPLHKMNHFSQHNLDNITRLEGSFPIRGRMKGIRECRGRTPCPVATHVNHSQCGGQPELKARAEAGFGSLFSLPTSYEKLCL